MRISDWSSDVCSSDLLSRSPLAVIRRLLYDRITARDSDMATQLKEAAPAVAEDANLSLPAWLYSDPEFFAVEMERVMRPSWQEIGRASCRERGCQYV